MTSANTWERCTLLNSKQRTTSRYSRQSKSGQAGSAVHTSTDDSLCNPLWKFIKHSQRQMDRTFVAGIDSRSGSCDAHAPRLEVVRADSMCWATCRFWGSVDTFSHRTQTRARKQILRGRPIRWLVASAFCIGISPAFRGWLAESSATSFPDGTSSSDSRVRFAASLKLNCEP